jgi:hypothetical protein
VFITREVLALAKPGARERQRILAFLEALATDPFAEGDFIEKDGDGREVQVKILGQYALTFWADHPVREVKVTKIVRADLEL